MRTRYCSRCLTSFVDDAPACPNLGCGRPRPPTGWSELLGAGDVLDKHYRVLRVVALAGGGITYKCRELDAFDEEVEPDLAIKVLYAHRDGGDHLLRLASEAQVLQHLAHAHIVECRGFVHRKGAPPYLVTRFEHGGTLQEHILRVGALRPDIAASCARQVLLALQQAHLRNVVHRDLKPQNVLLEAAVPRDEVPHLRVADFGIAKVTGGIQDGMTRVGAFVGTPEYAATEQFMGQPATPAADIFALGAMFYTCLIGQPPWVPTSRSDTVASLGELLARIPAQLPSRPTEAWTAAQAVLDATMRADPATRATPEELLRLLDTVIHAAHVDASEGTVALSEGATLAPGAEGFTWVEGNLLTDVPSRTQAATAQGLPSVVGASVTMGGPVAEVPRAEPRTLVADPLRTVASDLSLDALVDGFREEALAPALDPFEMLAARSAPKPPAWGGLPRAVAPPLATAPAAAQPGRARAPLVLGLPAPVGPGLDAPAMLPDAAVARFSLLGQLDLGVAEPAARSLVTLLQADLRGVGAVANGHRPGADPAVGVGMCRFAAMAARADWTSRLRALLADPSSEVRAAACDGLGHIGVVAALAPMAALVGDPDPRVRVALVRGLTGLALRVRRVDLARGAVGVLARDADPVVRDAAASAIDLLEGAC